MEKLSTPILDPAPSGTPHDWSLQRIQMLQGITVLPAYPVAWKNPFGEKVARVSQDKRGTCTGMSAKFGAEILYMMLTGDLPTEEDIAAQRVDVIDAIGTRYDTGYPRLSVSAEGFYQLGRYVGKVTYPSGGELRYVVRAWVKYGWFLESQWHTDKEGNVVWAYPPGIDAARMVANGNVSMDEANKFAQGHLIDGYAMCGSPDGSATWDEICSSIYTKGWVYGAIPVYENYGAMAGGDGTFPDPSGEISGYHALCFYGYDEDWLYLIHSWGNWCGQFGKISRKYFDYARNMCSWMVVLDKAETKIGQDAHTSLTITCSNVPTAKVSVNGVVVGIVPQKIAVETGKTYEITVSADGYESQTRTVTGTVTGMEFTLTALPIPEPEPEPVIEKNWFVKIIEQILNAIVSIFKKQ